MPGSAASRRGMYNQVRFLKLPTFLSSSQVGTFCFLLVSYLAAIFVPIGLEEVMEHREALTKFTQQALNDSQHSLFLLNAKMTLMRVFKKIEWP